MTKNDQHISGVEGLEDFVLAELVKERLASGEKRVRAVIDPETGEITFPDEPYGLTDLGCCGIMVDD